jgi:hemin uptake protein HemP
MTVHTYEHSDEDKDSVEFETHIRKALQNYQEPVLRIASNVLFSRPDGRIITRHDYRNMEPKVKWDVDQLHAVVIGSESMKETENGNQMLVLKDSNWQTAWNLRSIADIDWISGARVSVPLRHIMLHRWRFAVKRSNPSFR